MQDQELVQNHIENNINEIWNNQEDLINYTLRNPLVFGDFRNACIVDAARFYEDLLDYEAVVNLFVEVFKNLSIFSLSS